MSDIAKSCDTCKYRYVKFYMEPCEKCDGIELDRFEGFDWDEIGENPEKLCATCWRRVTPEWVSSGFCGLCRVRNPEAIRIQYARRPLSDRERAEAAFRMVTGPAGTDHDYEGVVGVSEDEMAEVRKRIAEGIGIGTEMLMGKEFPEMEVRNTAEIREERAVDPSRPDRLESREKAETLKTVYQTAVEEIIARQVEKGRGKYGVTLEDNETLTSTQRIEHLEEELVDGLMYCEHVKTAFSGSGLTADDYQRAALRTARADELSAEELLLNGAMGLCGEAGEVVDLVKKTRFQGHALSSEKLVEELGDVAWYLAIAAHALGVPLSTVLAANVEKLMKRYPDGFDKSRSIHREADGPAVP